MSAVAVRRRTAAPGPLHRRLVLGGFLLKEFGFETFEDVANLLRAPELEGLGSDGISRFCGELILHRSASALVDESTLLGYDDSIARHTAQIGAHRGEELRWRYFQYLALLVTERFLDRWFASRTAFAAALNDHLVAFNAAAAKPDRLTPYTEADLRRLAFWSATGSGKTLLMHVNLLQFRARLALNREGHAINREILLTPNEGLSRQHLEEMRRSGIAADLFTKDAPSLFSASSVEILDIQKLRETEGDKTVAVDAFGTDNLVLVDEGHRGAAGDRWMDFRDRLSEAGFSFEYSATFGQALGRDPVLSGRYAKWIGFDYAYRRFHADGYGKDYRILNLPDDDPTTRDVYLRGALLSFLQQRRYYDEQSSALAPYRLAPPLWVFVGSSVTGKLGTTGQTDVVAILLAFARFLRDRDDTEYVFDRLLIGDALLQNSGGGDLFDGCFRYLQQLNLDGEAAYHDVLGRVFNTASAGKLRVVLRKGVDGEIALQVGESAPFGLVNVGDASTLHRLCRDYPDDLICDEVQANAPLFDQLDRDPKMSVLIGAKKFIEGWSSWRVSSLGLMNVGKTEGAQIIQLFGRGVRLRGRGGGLKRSSALVPSADQPPAHIKLLETLTVFGVRADYMARFREHLQEEGAPLDESVEVEIPTILADPWPAGLKVIRLPAGQQFSRSSRCRLVLPSGGEPKPIALDWYPRVQAMISEGLIDPLVSPEANKNASPLQAKHLAFLDLDRIETALVEFKRQRGYWNLEVLPGDIETLLRHPAEWYRLEVPADRLRTVSPARIREWEDIAIALLKQWAVRTYRHEQSRWESPRLRYVDLEPSDPNMVDAHLITAPAEGDLADQLNEMRDEIAAGAPPRLVENLRALDIPAHLYQPLLALRSPTDLRVVPVALNDGEQRFVKDLREWASVDPDGLLVDRELHLLRNLSRGRGVGFFVAGNFYPDFILWLTGPGPRQTVLFVDPKGIARLGSIEHDKIQFRYRVKELEAELGDPNVRLASFILSNTRYSDVNWHNGLKHELEEAHVLFQSDDSSHYIGDMFRRALADTASPAHAETSI